MDIESAVKSKDFMVAMDMDVDAEVLKAMGDLETYPLKAAGLTGEMLFKLWKKLQADKVPPADEEAEAKDVASEEYAAELAAELAGVDGAAYIVKQMLAVGFYFGSRGAVPPDATGDKPYDLAQGPKSGYGVALLKEGDVYCGEYAEGKRVGCGLLKTAAGAAYCGEWLGGKKHGMGVQTYADGGKYTGDWKYGKRHGQGTFVYAGGDTYAGAWHAGAKHGAGVYVATGAQCTYEGTWRYGTLVASKMLMGSAGGSAYYGGFDAYGRPAGSGAFAMGNGVTLSGSYVAPPVEEAEGDEAAPALPSVWAGGAVGAAESSTDAALLASLTAVKPVLNVIIAGAPASGKGTQAEKLVATYGLYHLSTGDLLRAAAEDPDNEEGQKAKELMDAGELVPDELILKLVTQKLDAPEIRASGWLLDGFPRTEKQAKALEEYFLIPTKCILIDVPEEILVQRVTGRRLDPETGTIYHLVTKPVPIDPETGEPDAAITERLTQRDDDKEEVLVKRLENFRKNKEAVATTFASIALSVDGNKAPDEVFADIKAFIEG